MRQTLCAFLVATVAAFALSLSSGCRIRTVEPDEYKPATPGHLNPVEARQLISRLFSRHGIKLAYNARLNLRGVEIHADGWDFNLGIGYVYLIRPGEGEKVNFEVPKPPTANDIKVLEKIEKTEHTYIVWVNEGTEESITDEVNTFVEKLYKAGVLAKAREVKPKEGADGKAAPEEKADTPADDEPKKKEKSKVMKLIEDDSEQKEKKEDE